MVCNNLQSFSVVELLNAAVFEPEISVESAWHGHVPFASWLILQMQPKILVELGTHNGHAYLSFCQTVKKYNLSTQCYAVDTWQGDLHAGKYSDDVYRRLSSYHDPLYASFSKLLRKTFDEALADISDGSVEILHIDGLHTYEAVKHDFETWLPKLAPGAVVLFHDIAVHDRGFGVHRFWDELKQKYPHNISFFHSYGLGVLQISGDAQNFFMLNENEKKLFVNYFTKIGEAITDRDFKENAKRKIVGFIKMNWEIVREWPVIFRLRKVAHLIRDGLRYLRGR
jgi:hypothetical protein